MRKLRPKLRPQRIWTARIQKYCKSVESRKLRPWSKFPPRQNSDHGGDGGGSWVGQFKGGGKKFSKNGPEAVPTQHNSFLVNEFEFNTTGMLPKGVCFVFRVSMCALVLRPCLLAGDGGFLALWPEIRNIGKYIDFGLPKYGKVPPKPYSSKCSLPSDTKLLLTKNYSEINIFEELRISYVIPWKSPSFPEILKVRTPWKITKNNSQGIIFVIISCQKVLFSAVGIILFCRGCRNLKSSHFFTISDRRPEPPHPPLQQAGRASTLVIRCMLHADLLMSNKLHSSQKRLHIEALS